MQGKMVNAIATQNMAGVVSIGDSITVESVLDDVDTPKWVIHNNTTGKQFPSITFGYSPLSSWLKKLD